jgi:hypothetical protein
MLSVSSFIFYLQHEMFCRHDWEYRMNGWLRLHELRYESKGNNRSWVDNSRNESFCSFMEIWSRSMYCYCSGTVLYGVVGCFLSLLFISIIQLKIGNCFCSSGWVISGLTQGLDGFLIGFYDTHGRTFWTRDQPVARPLFTQDNAT